MIDRINLSTLLSTKSSKQSTATGADIVRGYRSWDRHALIQSVSSVLFDRTSVIDALPQVVVPTLLVLGEQDTVLPTAFGRRIAARLQRSKFVEVLEAAHLIPLEQPDLAIQLISEFLQNLPE